MPFWMTVTVWPATVSVPLRWAVDVLAVAPNATVPFPDPLAPLLIVSQAALLTAVQLQPVGALTAVEEEPAAGPNVAEVGDTPKVHAAPA